MEISLNIVKDLIKYIEKSKYFMKKNLIPYAILYEQRNSILFKKKNPILCLFVFEISW